MCVCVLVRSRVFGLDSAIVSDIERVLAAVQRSRSRAAELAGGALGSDTPLADAASSVGVGGPAAGGERATRSTLAAPSGVDRTGSVDAGQAALGAVRPPPAAAGDADGAAGERAALSASPSSGEEELGGPTPSQIRDLWTTYLQQMRRSVRRRAVKLEVFLVTFLRALRDKALNAVMLQGDPSRNGRREELLLFVLESIKVILWTARIGWEPPGELGVRDLLSLCVHGSARATDARTLFAAGFFGQMSRDEVQSVLERGDATLYVVSRAGAVCIG